MRCPSCNGEAVAMRIVAMQRFACCLACLTCVGEGPAAFEPAHDVAFV